MDLTTPRPVWLAHMHRERFTDDFLAYLPDNLHIWEAFEQEALKIARKGFKHYSARTIIEVLRHHSALNEKNGGGLEVKRPPYSVSCSTVRSRPTAACRPVRVSRGEGREEG